MSAPLINAPARIAVLGAGRMGRGLAHVFAYAGYSVDLIDFKPRPDDAARRVLDEARAEIARTLALTAELGLIDPAAADAALARVSLHPADAAEAALAAADFVFEGVPETLAAKADALGRAAAWTRPDCIIASTTSTSLSDALAALVPGPERFLNAHWLNPAFLIPLVEVSPAAATAPATTARLTDLLTAIGKAPVLCAASPGFIVPRIQALAMNEAARLAEEGVASPADIDRATRLGFGLRFAVLGLLEFIDWGGGDILFHASTYLARELKDDRFSPPRSVVENMAAGRIGMTAGAGFHDYSGLDVAARRRERLQALVTLLAAFDLLPKAAPLQADFNHTGERG